MFKWGIMATGIIAETFAKAVTYAENAECYACASRNLPKAEEFAQRLGFKKAYGTYEELAADPDVDIIYVATPMSCHYDNVKLCIDNGKNVLCEKSLTCTKEEAQKLIALAREKGVFFMEAMWMKCLPVFRKALEWFKSGKIGAIETIRVDFSNFVKFDPASRLFRKDLGGGAILDLGVYPVTLITAFLGFDYNKIVKYTNYGEIEIDRNDLIIFEYPNGVYTSSVIGFDIENENRAVIVGDKGRIAFDPWFFCTTKAKLYNKAGELLEDFDQPHPCNGYEFEILEAQHCLDKGLKESEIIPLEDSQRIMDILDYLLTQKSEVR